MATRAALADGCPSACATSSWLHAPFAAGDDGALVLRVQFSARRLVTFEAFASQVEDFEMGVTIDPRERRQDAKLGEHGARSSVACDALVRPVDRPFLIDHRRQL